MKKNLLPALAAASLLAPSLALAASPQDAAQPKDSIARGLMIQHGERLIFSPCRERSYVPVEDQSPGGETITALRTLGLAENAPLYVELFGAAEGGTLQVSGLNFAHTDARCPAPRHATGAWQAAGDTPLWRFTLIGDVLHLERAAHDTLRVPIKEEVSAAATHLRAADGSDLQWTLEKSACLNRAQGFVSGWSASGQADGQSLTGCAWKP